MSQTLINTLRFADHLKEAGFAGPQAEALARVLSEVWGTVPRGYGLLCCCAD